MPELVSGFERESGLKVVATFGSSGNFFAQIQNAAPFDVFFSADMSYPEKLVMGGFADRETLREYARGHLVLWVASESGLNPARDGWKTLMDARVKRIAIANPEHAPYGRAGVAALQNSGFYDQVKSRLVFGDNISQAAQFVQSGSAQAGIVAKSLANSPAMKNGKWWEIPLELYPAMNQGVVIASASPNKEAGARFIAYLCGAKGREILTRYGFDPAGASKP